MNTFTKVTVQAPTGLIKLESVKDELINIDMNFHLLETVKERHQAFKQRKELQAIYVYILNVKDIFLEHHCCMGQCLEEAEDVWNESEFFLIERWLIKQGYDLLEGLEEYEPNELYCIADLHEANIKNPGTYEAWVTVDVFNYMQSVSYEFDILEVEPEASDDLDIKVKIFA